MRVWGSAVSGCERRWNTELRVCVRKRGEERGGERRGLMGYGSKWCRGL